ncbi:MAG: 3-dehydroquinate synthase [Acidaminococcaceae bacterium]|nr:3-dehydroquinate synthase [Acidaminococcaceae bacterium]
MPKISVDLGKNSYDILIAKGVWSEIGVKIHALSSADKIAIITDSNVENLYGKYLQQQLAAEGFQVSCITIAPGETSKNLEVLGQVYAALANFGITRGDLIVTLGGGVPGDLGGFAAATFLRGIDFIQIPTTLLAQVDSSVGGKVAVDLPAGKNLVGSFYQPKAVFIDPILLNTLPLRYLHDGLAEVIKYGAFGDEKLWSMLEGIYSDAKLLANITEIIAACCTIKARIVKNDEFDLGERMLLNFGHTIGHAVEKCYDYEKYTHGEGVGIGMVRLTEQTEKLGLTEQGTSKRLRAILAQYKLPTDVELSQKQIMDVINLDKKKNGSNITLIVLDKIGSGRLLKIAYVDLAKYIV